MVNERKADGRLDQLEGDISSLGRSVAGLAEGQKALSSSVADLRDSIQQLGNRVNAPQATNWSAILAAIALAGTLGVAFLTPVAKQADANQGDLRSLSGAIGDIQASLSTGRERGKANREALNAFGKATIEQGREIAALEAEMLLIQERLRDVDLRGSRKWVEDRR